MTNPLNEIKYSRSYWIVKDARTRKEISRHYLSEDAAKEQAKLSKQGIVTVIRKEIA